MNEEEETTNNGFTLTKLISGLTIISFTFGIVNLYVYYSFFKLNIFEYLDFTEIINHTIRDSLLLAIPYVVLLLIGLLIGERTVKNGKPGGKPKYKLNLDLIFFLLLIGILIFNIAEFILGKVKLPMFLFLTITLFMPYLSTIPGKIRNQYNLKSKKPLTYYEYLFIFLCFASFYLSITNSLLKVDNVKNLHSTKGSYIIMNKDTINSTDAYFYIGRTKNNLFFFNAKTNATDIYFDRNITKISLNDAR